MEVVRVMAAHPSVTLASGIIAVGVLAAGSAAQFAGSSGDETAVISGVAAVIVALIAGAFQLYRIRTKPDPEAVNGEVRLRVLEENQSQARADLKAVRDEQARQAHQLDRLIGRLDRD